MRAPFKCMGEGPLEMLHIFKKKYIMSGVISISIDLDFQKYMIHGVFVRKNSSRTSVYLEDVLIILAFLTFLMTIMMSGVISIDLDISYDFKKYMIYGVERTQ